MKDKKAQQLTMRTLLISLVIIIIALILLVAFSKQGLSQFMVAWKDQVFNPAGIG